MGLNRKDVVLKEYTEEWNEMFLCEKDLLLKLIGNRVIEIQHVGSTSIKGLKAKPIIDIAIGVRNLEDTLEFVDELEHNGYEFRGDAGVKGRYFFAKGSADNRTHYLHVEEFEGEIWDNHILFRDYLINNPQKIEEYQTLKELLADKYPNDRIKYTDGKSNFIQNIIKLAKNKK